MRCGYRVEILRQSLRMTSCCGGRGCGFKSNPPQIKKKNRNLFCAEVDGCARQRKKHCVESQWLRKRIHRLGHNAFFLFRCKPTSLGFAASNFVASCIKQKRPWNCARRDGERTFVRRADAHPRVFTVSVTKVLSLSIQADCVGLDGAYFIRVQASYPTHQNKKGHPFGCPFCFGARGGT